VERRKEIEVFQVRLLQKSYGKGGQGIVAQASRLWTLATLSPQAPAKYFSPTRLTGRWTFDLAEVDTAGFFI